MSLASSQDSKSPRLPLSLVTSGVHVSCFPLETPRVHASCPLSRLQESMSLASSQDSKSPRPSHSLVTSGVHVSRLLLRLQELTSLTFSCEFRSLRVHVSRLLSRLQEPTSPAFSCDFRSSCLMLPPRDSKSPCLLPSLETPGVHVSRFP